MVPTLMSTAPPPPPPPPAEAPHQESEPVAPEKQRPDLTGELEKKLARLNAARENSYAAEMALLQAMCDALREVSVLLGAVDSVRLAGEMVERRAEMRAAC